MYIQQRFNFTGIALAMLLSGCGDSEQRTPAKTTDQATVIPVLPAIDGTTGIKTPPLDLTIKQEMLEDIELAPGIDGPEFFMDESLKKTSRPNKLSFKGKLLLDETRPDYMDAVGGAEVNVEIKFD